MQINLKPEPKQYVCWQYLQDKITSYILFGGAAGGGKSWAACEWLIYMCYVYPETKWFIGREELKRILNSTYITFQKVLRHHNIPQGDWTYNGQQNFLLNNVTGSRIDFLDLKYLPTDPMFERFGSMEYTGGFIEEAGEVDFGAFDVLKTRVGRHLNQELKIKPKILLTCNPSKGWLKDVFYLPWKKGTLEKDYAFIPATFKDNKHTADIYGEQLEKISNESIKKRLRDGDWDFEDKGTLFKRVDENIADTLKDPVPQRQYAMGVDLARIHDYTVISVIDKQTFEVVYYDRFNQIDWNLQKSKIEAVARRYNMARIKIDATGVGDPIYNDLQKQGLSIEPITLTSRTKKEIVDNLIILFEQDKLKIPRIEEMIEELKAFTYTWNEKTKAVKYGAPSGKHDDIVISLALAFAREEKIKGTPKSYNFNITYDNFGRPILG